MPVNPDQFRAALGRFASGVTVVTTRDKNGRLHGITVSSFCSVSLEPPLILVCIDKRTGSHYALEQTGSFVVNILREDQQYISDRFASLAADKFDDIKYRSGIDDLPVLEDVLVNLECSLIYSHAGGDHTIYVGQIEHATVSGGKPLVYFHGKYRKLED